MKIESHMIDKQLRVPGAIAKSILKLASIDDFVKLRKKGTYLRGKKIRGIQCEERWILRKQDGSKLRICVYKPLEQAARAPGLLWMHGGGYALNLPESSLRRIKNFIVKSGCVVVAPDYRLSLDAPYPAALQDCHESLVWIKEHAEELGVRTDQLMVGGESAGGGLTAALTLYERDIGGVKIAFQMPLYPMIDDSMTSESATDNDAPVWDSVSNRIAWELYLGGLKESEVPIYAAPARNEDFRGLPPACTFVGDLEPFRDETIQYVANLKKAGVPVDFELFPGCFHAFDITYPYADVSQGALAFLDKSFLFAIEHYFAAQ